MINLTITGIQEAQQANLRRIADLQPSGAFGRVVKDMTIHAHAEAVKATHVDTGALRASHRIKIEGLTGEVFIDRAAVNPRSRQKTSVYGPIEHARGGGHAFYELARQRTLPVLARLGKEIAIQVAR